MLHHSPEQLKQRNGFIELIEPSLKEHWDTQLILICCLDSFYVKIFTVVAKRPQCFKTGVNNVVLNQSMISRVPET